MSKHDGITALVETLEKFKPGNPLRHYITHAVFPKFKNIEPGMRIDFDFPLTALVGANGIGKSSLLHALWGMPYGYSTSKFWFSTDLDPIVEPQRYFYGYWNEDCNNIVETRKARIGKKADYWEPYRWSAPDGMMPMLDGNFASKAKDRWHPVRRKVVYINFRALFGSFDRFFYFDNDFGKENRHKVMLQAAHRLKIIKEEFRLSYMLGRRQRIFENRTLEQNELDEVSKILGRSYDAAHLIRHSLYPGNRGKDLSVIFKRGSEYSEAFAGSGEIAAVSTVVDVLAAEDYSLILLDEPETSLHPGAQRALLKFLLEQIKLKKHQVVLSTHSSEFLTELPHTAIKVFEDNGNFQCRILPRSSPAAALNRLGKLPQNKRRILVEDSLAELLVLHAAQSLDIGDRETFEVKIAPGGAESILKYLGPSSMVSGDNVFIMLDGDKKKVEEFSDPNKIAPADYAGLDDLIKRELGLSPKYFIQGGQGDDAHKKAKIDSHLKYLEWLRVHLSFFPKTLPEHIILEALDPAHSYSELDSNSAKKKLKELLSEGAKIELDAEQISTLAKVKIASIPQSNTDLAAIRKCLEIWLHI
ncbi:ATPase [Betaproteobacteria bacterium]|nr:ATPase [Betaproteobacteria bacterium]GHU03642.1 ATPase [Betaproteobacteria bacterium]GHU21512.1 ATPase [Betaproteobacteria bacterium]